ncbi:hypothetical protein JOF36_001388 [Pseudonocardia parietis]|uniref:Uncharacterized protein n=1 Tax=Pseudonocardia parietis TaxID=570936 RepID=A0ABS4VP40_9PSEU|nr:hypothetical protein [Pseudonocardia parietis]
MTTFSGVAGSTVVVGPYLSSSRSSRPAPRDGPRTLRR